VLEVPTRTDSPCSGHRGTGPEPPAPPAAAAAALEALVPLPLAPPEPPLALLPPLPRLLPLPPCLCSLAACDVPQSSAGNCESRGGATMVRGTGAFWYCCWRWCCCWGAGGGIWLGWLYCCCQLLLPAPALPDTPVPPPAPAAAAAAAGLGLGACDRAPAICSSCCRGGSHRRQPMYSGSWNRPASTTGKQLAVSARYHEKQYRICSWSDRIKPQEIQHAQLCARITVLK
jgi:hypothetical protein